MALAAPRICCLDLDTFFVSVERLLDPTLVGKPVVVGGLPGSAASSPRRATRCARSGVRSGMSLTRPSSWRPTPSILPTRHGVYGDYAERVRRIAEAYTPLSQVASIDEMFLDFSGCERLYRRPATPTRDATIERVVRELTDRDRGARRAAGERRHRHQPGRWPRWRAAWPSRAACCSCRPAPRRRCWRRCRCASFPGIGPVAEQQAARARPHDARPTSRRHPRATLRRDLRRLGRLDPARLPRPGRARARPRAPRVPGARSRGLQRSAASPTSAPSARTCAIRRRIESMLCSLCERVCWRARKRGVKARTVTLKLRYADFHTLHALAHDHARPARSSSCTRWCASCSSARAAGGWRSACWASRCRISGRTTSSWSCFRGTRRCMRRWMGSGRGMGMRWCILR